MFDSELIDSVSDSAQDLFNSAMNLNFTLFEFCVSQTLNFNRLYRLKMQLRMSAIFRLNMSHSNSSSKSQKTLKCARSSSALVARCSASQSLLQHFASSSRSQPFSASNLRTFIKTLIFRQFLRFKSIRIYRRKNSLDLTLHPLRKFCLISQSQLGLDKKLINICP